MQREPSKKKTMSPTGSHLRGSSKGISGLPVGGMSPTMSGGKSGASGRHGGVEDGDPEAVLRLRQTAEYKKLCLELRVPESSAALQGLCSRPRHFASEAPDAGREAADADADEALDSQPNSPSSQMDGRESAAGSRSQSKLSRSQSKRSSKDSESLHESSAAVAAALGPHEYDFSRYVLGDRQMRPLAAALAVDRQLLSLCLAGVGIFDNGMVALCEQLRRSALLERLNVSRNRFSGPGAEACLGLAKSAQRLVRVDKEDTVLDADFAFKRGLPVKFASLRVALEKVLTGRLRGESDVPGDRPAQRRQSLCT